MVFKRGLPCCTPSETAIACVKQESGLPIKNNIIVYALVISCILKYFVTIWATLLFYVKYQINFYYFSFDWHGTDIFIYPTEFSYSYVIVLDFEYIFEY